jgi:hypothetical protein
VTRRQHQRVTATPRFCATCSQLLEEAPSQPARGKALVRSALLFQAAALARAALSGSSAEVRKLLSRPPQERGGVSAADGARSLVAGNVAQARAQLRDPDGAEKDAAKALLLDPSNVKAAVRQPSADSFAKDRGQSLVFSGAVVAGAPLPRFGGAGEVPARL